MLIWPTNSAHFLSINLILDLSEQNRQNGRTQNDDDGDRRRRKEIYAYGSTMTRTHNGDRSILQSLIIFRQLKLGSA